MGLFSKSYVVAIFSTAAVSGTYLQYFERFCDDGFMGSHDPNDARIFDDIASAQTVADKIDDILYESDLDHILGVRVKELKNCSFGYGTLEELIDFYRKNF